MLELNQVDSFYGNSPILQKISLGLEKGGFISILGRNGMGKTMLLKTIMGLTDRIRGEIRLGHLFLTPIPTHLRARCGIGYVPQGREIIAQFSVKDNIHMGCYARRDNKKKIPDLALELFPYLRDNLNRRAGLLSGGQQQQLAIARALASDPDILLLDEPTEGIQPNIVGQIEQAIIRLNQEFGLSILLVEQNIAFARRASRHFLMMNNGRVATTGSISELTDSIVHQYMTI